MPERLAQGRVEEAEPAADGSSAPASGPPLVSPARSLTPGDVLRIQRHAGNRAARSAIAIGTPGATRADEAQIYLDLLSTHGAVP